MALLENVRFGLQRPAVIHQRLGLAPVIAFKGGAYNMPPGQPNARLNNGMRFGVNGLNGLGAYALDANGNVLVDPVTGSPIQESDTNSIADLVTKGLALLNSQQVFQLNLSRAQQGLPPINVPQPQINLGIAGINSSTLLLIGAGLLALLLLKR